MSDALAMTILSCIAVLFVDVLRRETLDHDRPTMSILLTALWILALAVWLVCAIRLIRGLL